VQGSGDGKDDKEARFTALYERHYRDVLRYAARRAGTEAAAEVAAETFLTAWRRLDVVPDHQPLPWLYVTARQCLANELRKQERRQRLDTALQIEAGAGAQDVRAGPADSPDSADATTGHLDVLAALATLPANDQEALRLTEWEELDHAAAARAAGCSATAFKVRLHRARRRLARALDEQASPEAAARLATRIEVHP
jgi:RNA polymerase sigma factor (sigma-70 family)